MSTVSTCLGCQPSPETRHRGAMEHARRDVACLSTLLSLTAVQVGEHVPAEHERMFVRNVHAHNCRGVIVSWARPGTWGHGPGWHKSPPESYSSVSVVSEEPAWPGCRPCGSQRHDCGSVALQRLPPRHGHVNNRDPKYVRDLFAQLGYQPHGALTAALRNGTGSHLLEPGHPATSGRNYWFRRPSTQAFVRRVPLRSPECMQSGGTRRF